MDDARCFTEDDWLVYKYDKKSGLLETMLIKFG